MPAVDLAGQSVESRQISELLFARVALVDAADHAMRPRRPAVRARRTSARYPRSRFFANAAPRAGNIPPDRERPCRRPCRLNSSPRRSAFAHCRDRADWRKRGRSRSARCRECQDLRRVVAPGQRVGCRSAIHKRLRRPIAESRRDRGAGACAAPDGSASSHDLRFAPAGFVVLLATIDPLRLPIPQQLGNAANHPASYGKTLKNQENHGSRIDRHFPVKAV